MAAYPQLALQVKRAELTRQWDEVVAYLIELWVEDYSATTGESDLVRTSTGSFSYLFDVKAGRLVAAWGVSLGPSGATRDAARMAGHPKAGGNAYHRGHAISHRLGGGTDINLVPQLGTVNVGPFRRLEREALATPGSLYFTHWIYVGAAPVAGGPSQIPTAVDQGLLVFGRPPRIQRHHN